MTHPIGVVDGAFAGTDPHAVYARQLAEIGPPHVPALAELPAVGPHANGLGKVIANMGLPFELRTYGWQLQHGDRITSVDQRRAIAHRDILIQALVDVAEDAAVPEISVRLLGPVATIIAGMLPSGQRILHDAGARRDVAAGWAAALDNLTARVRDVVGAHTTVFVQEQQAEQAVHGTIRSVSGVDVERAIDHSEIRSMWELAVSVDATVLFETSPGLWATAADVGSVAVDWPTGRSTQTERTWQLVDELVTAEKPVALHVPWQGEPKRRAEELLQQYFDWDLPSAGLEHVRLSHRISEQDSDHTVGARLEWLRTLVEQAGGYLTTL